MNNSDVLNDETAKSYFLGLFPHSLDTIHLNNLWQSISTTLLSPQEKVDWAVEATVAVLERNVLKDREHKDQLLVSSIIKADRRREAKKRNKDRKRSMKTMEEFSSTKLGKSLSSEEMSAFMTVKEILGNSFFRRTPETIVSVLLQHNYDINLSIDQLLINDDDKEVSNTNILVEDVPILKESSVQQAHNESNLSTKRLHNVTATDVVLLSMQPLLDHFIRHLRSRNPGIIAQWEDDCMIYKGMREGLRLTSNPCELTVSIDLHGLTRKPAVDILQSSMLYYQGILLSGRFNPSLLEAAASDRIYSGSKKRTSATTNSSKYPKYLEIKSIIILYVVGQGIHSAGAIPVLRNTFMHELGQFWSEFDYGIDKENPGSIYVRVKCLR